MVLRVQGSGCYWAFESGFFWSRVSSLGLKGRNSTQSPDFTGRGQASGSPPKPTPEP